MLNEKEEDDAASTFNTGSCLYKKVSVRKYFTIP